MYEQTINFWDIAIVAIIVGGAAYFIYRKVFKKKNACGGGCDSCPSSLKKNN
ncbi:FeoB-associated Cys-rich membrane protein [Vibrio sp. YMD68]|uniref:FeoB-associated Cys-rich membrane protein n=1 Tax=Vibrio sp. YMD68 TaxID=3042300 RepID=UPI00249A256C|nr:FeoB-associated Cys-rich membrane protein [Vibrio sp. YMD68]WGV98863.1 FeoB-associated Cys-rich membrane protein [Vibrio sp. YMD68]